MKIAVIGAGAIGGLVGAKLALAGEEIGRASCRERMLELV